MSKLKGLQALNCVNTLYLEGHITEAQKNELAMLLQKAISGNGRLWAIISLKLEAINEMDHSDQKEMLLKECLKHLPVKSTAST